MSRLKVLMNIKLEDRTRFCWKRLGWLVVWSERL